MNPVNILLYNALAQYRGVNLPGIGALGVNSIPATMGPNQTLIPPRKLVVYYPDEQAGFTSVLDLIVEANPLDAVAAAGIYAQWKSERSPDAPLDIPTVGKLKNGNFMTAPELYSALNPIGDKPVKLSKPVSMSQIVLWIAIAALVGGGLSVGLITWLNSQPDTFTKPLVVTETENVSNTAVTAPATSPEQIPTEAHTQPASENTASSSKTEEVGSATTDSAISTPAAAATNDTRYYVVIGMYSTDANAEKFISASKRQNDRLTYHKMLLRNGKFMVYTASGSTEAEASKLRRDIVSDFPEAWIFKYKN